MTNKIIQEILEIIDAHHTQYGKQNWKIKKTMLAGTLLPMSII